MKREKKLTNAYVIGGNNILLFLFLFLPYRFGANVRKKFSFVLLLLVELTIFIW